MSAKDYCLYCPNCGQPLLGPNDLNRMICLECRVSEDLKTLQMMEQEKRTFEKKLEKF